MINTSQWFLNAQQDVAIYTYPPDGTYPEPPVIEYTGPDTCGKGVYTGDIVLLPCGDFLGRIGIGSTEPQQKLDVEGSIKIDDDIYDSVNSPGLIGYTLSKDFGGIRWLPPLNPNPPGAPGFVGGAGIETSFFFILFDGIPVVGIGTTDVPVA